MAANRSKYVILEASIIMSTVKAEDYLVDVRGNIVEINVYEHLYKPYLDASIVLVDDFGLKDALKIQGTERLRLVLANANSPDDPVVVKYFFFSKITDSQKTNDRAEILAIDLVEEHVYVNAVKQFSKSYTDRLENIIVNIAQNQLGRDVDTLYFGGSVQGVRKVIVPYISPLEAIQWMRDRATTRTGGPIYLYSSMYNRNLLMSDLDNLLRQEVINEDAPLRYSDATSMMDDKDESKRSYFEIYSYSEVDTENSMELYEEGAIGSLYSSLDTSTGRPIEDHITIRNILGEFYANELITTKSTQSVFDPSLEIDGKLSDEYNSNHIHQVVSTGTYNQFKGYHDETSLLDNSNSIIESRLKIKNKIIRHIMKKNVIDIGMAGNLYFEGEISVGRKIRTLFLNSNVQGDENSASEQVDKGKSGDYLIIALAHKFIDEKHTTVARLAKLADLPRDFKL